MAYDPDLVDRLETALRAEGAEPVRKAMFGGIAFLINGNMSYGTSKDELHVRVGPEAYEAALKKPGAGPMEFTGRSMKGWVTVEGPSDLNDEELSSWARMTLNFVRTLPVK